MVETNVEVKVDLQTLNGWIVEYRVDHDPVTQDYDAERVNDFEVWVTLAGDVDQDPEFDGGFTMTQTQNLVTNYLNEGPEVEDHWTDYDERVIRDLGRYLDMRWENYLEGLPQ